MNDGIGPRVEESFEVESVESDNFKGDDGESRTRGQQAGLRTLRLAADVGECRDSLYMPSVSCH